MFQVIYLFRDELVVKFSTCIKKDGNIVHVKIFVSWTIVVSRVEDHTQQPAATSKGINFLMNRASQLQACRLSLAVAASIKHGRMPINLDSLLTWFLSDPHGRSNSKFSSPGFCTSFRSCVFERQIISTIRICFQSGQRTAAGMLWKKAYAMWWPLAFATLHVFSRPI